MINLRVFLVLTISGLLAASLSLNPFLSKNIVDAMEISVKNMESGVGIRKNQTLICAPIMRDTVDQMVELMHKAKFKGSDFLEVRLDHMKTFNPDVDIGKMIKE